MNTEIDKKNIMSANLLKSKKIAPIDWIIDELLPEGLTILAGKPKVGKSFLALNIASKIANSVDVFGKYKTNRRKILYITNEDSERRIHDRLSQLDIKTNDLSFYFEKFRIDDDFEQSITNLADEAGAKFIIIDTMAKAFNLESKKSNGYFEEYKKIGDIQSVISRKGISILLVHHMRKMSAEYAPDRILGSNGISGGVDTIWLLDRSAGKSKLTITGKDVMEQELEFITTKNKSEWIVLNESNSGLGLSPEREEIIHLLIEAKISLSSKAISGQLSKPSSAVNRLLNKMRSDGILISPRYGKYELSPSIKNLYSSSRSGISSSK